jgi:lipoyl(octanoyl) transferase
MKLPGGQCNLVQLGRMSYEDALKLQRNIAEARRDHQIEDTLLLLEHPPVITIGRSGNSKNILASREILESEGIRLYTVDRGGDVAYHGPGQLIGYPIINLANHGKDIHSYVYGVEKSIVELLKREYAVETEIVQGYVGVWHSTEKIAAIGVTVRSWITTHGFALNVDPDMNHFAMIHPCGIKDRGVTSLSKILNRKVTVDEVAKKYPKYFGETFGVEMSEITLEELMGCLH